MSAAKSGGSRSPGKQRKQREEDLEARTSGSLKLEQSSRGMVTRVQPSRDKKRKAPSTPTPRPDDDEERTDTDDESDSTRSTPPASTPAVSTRRKSLNSESAAFDAPAASPRPAKRPCRKRNDSTVQEAATLLQAVVAASSIASSSSSVSSSAVPVATRPPPPTAVASTAAGATEDCEMADAVVAAAPPVILPGVWHPAIPAASSLPAATAAPSLPVAATQSRAVTSSPSVTLAQWSTELYRQPAVSQPLMHEEHQLEEEPHSSMLPAAPEVDDLNMLLLSPAITHSPTTSLTASAVSSSEMSLSSDPAASFSFAMDSSFVAAALPAPAVSSAMTDEIPSFHSAFVNRSQPPRRNELSPSLSLSRSADSMEFDELTGEQPLFLLALNIRLHCRQQ